MQFISKSIFVSLKIEKIFLTNEFHDTEYLDENTDVIVQMDSGEKYIASIFTYEGLKTIRNKHLKTDSYLKGKYFWTKHMLVIDSCDMKSVQTIVDHLIEEGDFKDVFGLLSTQTK